jgi:hypothetical protein
MIIELESKKKALMVKEEEERGWDGITVFMAGLIAGGLAAVGMVIYVNS